MPTTYFLGSGLTVAILAKTMLKPNSFQVIETAY